MTDNVITPTRRENMRIGKVQFVIEMVVDLDDAVMVENAKERVEDHIINLVTYNDVNTCICIVPDNTLCESDITDVLLEMKAELDEIGSVERCERCER